MRPTCQLERGHANVFGDLRTVGRPRFETGMFRQAGGGRVTPSACQARAGFST